MMYKIKLRNNILVLEIIFVLETDELLFFIKGLTERNDATARTVDKKTGKTAGLENHHLPVRRRNSTFLGPVHHCFIIFPMDL